MVSRPTPLLVLLVAAVSFAARADFVASQAAAAYAITDQQYAAGLTQLTDFRFLPDGRMVLTERMGAVKLRRNNGTVVTVGTFPVDLSDPELGLLAVEVHPSFATNSTLFFYLSVQGEGPATRNRVVSATLAGEVLNTSGAVAIVSGIPAPSIHNGGGLAVGNGHLYVSVGDTGCACACSPGGSPVAGAGFNYTATCLTSPNGKVLRVLLNGAIPPGNPLAGQGAVTACEASCRTPVAPTPGGPPRSDIWAWGFRDPRRIWFDSKTNALWLADQGELTLDEIDVVTGGKHYGFPFREGDRGADAGSCADATPSSGPCTPPVYSCLHTGASGPEQQGCDGLIGGPIVDLCSWPEPLAGRYFFADAASGNLYTLVPNPARTGFTEELRLTAATFTPGVPVSIQLGPDGALYVGVRETGSSSRVSRLSPLTAVACPADGGSDGGPLPDSGLLDGGRGDGGASGPVPVCCSAGSPFDAGSGACGCVSEPGSSGFMAWWLFVAGALVTLAARRLARKSNSSR